jgi:hypothetical protein
MTTQTAARLQRIGEVPGNWVVTHCECRGTGYETGEAHELERESQGRPWRCPNCLLSVKEMLMNDESGRAQVAATRHLMESRPE